jgi:hypothetical protein
MTWKIIFSESSLDSDDEDLPAAAAAQACTVSLTTSMHPMGDARHYPLLQRWLGI